MADASSPRLHRPWAVIQHVPFEGPGALAPLAAERGIQLQSCGVYNGDPLPAVSEIGGLIVMGGPMGVYEADRYPHLKDEMERMRQAVARGLPVLGICLGAQLLAQAMGGNVYQGPVLEIGAGAVTLTEAGRRDAVFSEAGPALPVMHWHQDTFTLPPGATHLAESSLYPHQAFRLGRLAYGLQFHIEVDEQLADDWAPHLPPNVTLAPTARAAIAAIGRKILARYFDAALAGA